MAAYAEITGVDFAIADDADRERAAAVEVRSYELFAEDRPVDEGLYDPRMGTTDHHYVCSTCREQKKRCPGHYGLVRLRAGVPLPFPDAVHEARRWLRVVCHDCGQPLVDPARYAALPPAQRLAKAGEAHATAKRPGRGEPQARRCQACGAAQPKILADPGDKFSLLVERTPGDRRRMSPDDMRAIFERVPEALVRALGRPATSHPARLVVRSVIVPPITTRPGVKLGLGGAGGQSQHDLNTMLQYLVRHNASLPTETEGLSPEARAEYERSRQVLAQLYYDLVLGSSAAARGGKRAIVAGGRPSPAILRRLTGKKGRLRGNLLGKRTWFAVRSTISGNAILPPVMVGLPRSFARILQVEETVQEYNRERLATYFHNGRSRYPGSTRVFRRATGTLHEVEGLRAGDLQLEPGDVLYRDVVTGDACFFNRPPSLQLSSIGCHTVQVLDDPEISTLQMNVTACEWYNADFDGDQMLLWVARGPASRVEARLLAHVHNLLISVKNSGIVPGQVQDSVVGSWLLTRGRARLDRRHAMALFRNTRLAAPLVPFRSPSAWRSQADSLPSKQSAEPESAADSGTPEKAPLTGRDAVSLLFASHFPVDYAGETAWYSEARAPYLPYRPDEIRVRMEKGHLLEGVLDKRAVGAGASRGLFQLAARLYGPDRALRAIFALQQMAIDYVGNAGFTVSANDMTVPAAARAEVAGQLAGLLREAAEINRRLLAGELLPPLNMTTREFYEQLMINTLRLPDRILGPVLGSFDPETNGMLRMVGSGSKGSDPNLINIAAAVGPIEINTRRLEPHFAFGRSSLYFPRFALDPAAYGFVANCYVGGLTSPEYFAASMNGRFDLINKALSTASTGYLNRKAVLALQTCLVDNMRRLTVNRRVAQFLYGDDGLDPRAVENVSFAAAWLSEAELRAEYAYTDFGGGQADAGARALFEAEAARLWADCLAFRRTFLALERSDFEMPVPRRRLVPVRVDWLVAEAALGRQGPAAEAPGPDLAALVAMRRMADRFCDQLAYVYGNEGMRLRGLPLPAHLEAGAGLARMHVRFALCTRRLAEARLDPARLEALLEQIRVRYARALAPAGCAAGVLAAQSVSEPLTQYMLDSHHRSVSGGTNKSGILRPQEILGARGRKRERSSEMLLPLALPAGFCPPDRHGPKPPAGREGAPGDAAADSQPQVWWDEGSKTFVAEGEGRAHELATAVELVSLEDFLRHWELLLEPFGAFDAEAGAPSGEESLYPGDAAWVRRFAAAHPLLPPPSDLTRWCVRCVLDREALVLKSLSLEFLVGRLRVLFSQAYIAHAPETSPELVLRVQLRAAAFKRAEPEKTALAFAEKLQRAPLRGVAGIRGGRAVQVTRHHADAAGRLVPVKQWAVQTVGTNLPGLAPLLGPGGLDPARAVSSSLGDTLRVFGIEAARLKVVSELRRVLGDKAPNPRHLYVLADAMTFSGRLVSLEASGIDIRDRSNVLLRMAASAPIQVLGKAAFEGTRSEVYGLAAPLMLGSAPRLGTHYNDVAVNEAFVAERTKSLAQVLDEL